MTMKFSETGQFSKELKRLSKKYISLPEDLIEFKKVVASIPCGTGKHFVKLHDGGDFKIMKSRLFCKYIRGSALRIIYDHHEKQRLIEFIELYFKGDKKREDQERLKEYINARTCQS